MNFYRIKGIFFRHLYEFVKGTHSMVDLFYWPLVDILLWGITSIWIVQHHASNLILVLMTAMIFWQITRRGSNDVSVSLVAEFWNRNLVNLFSTPLSILEWSIGVLLLSLCKIVVIIIFGVGVIFCLYELNVLTIGWPFIPFAVSLMIFGWVIGFLAASVIIYGGHSLEPLAWMIPFIFAPFSAVFLSRRDPSSLGAIHFLVSSHILYF